MSERVTTQLQKVNTKHVAPKDSSLLQREDKDQPEPTTLTEQLFDDVSATFGEPRFGYDFSQVPVHTNMAQQTMTMLRTQKMVQRFPKDEDAGIVPCSTCSEAESTENSTVVEPTTEVVLPAVDTASTPKTLETTEETTMPEEVASPGLIVEDSATELRPSQIRKSEFLAQLRAEVCRTVEVAIAETGQTTDSCPFIGHWFDFYSRKDSAHIERAIRRYAPEASNATTARGYISAVTQRARQSAETWARTGEITGVPEGIPIGLPGSGLLGGLLSGLGGIFFKARNGGARKSGDPKAIQARLGSGQPLDSSVRSRMESVFSRDFSHVRTHTDTTAAGLSDGLNARAFTLGKDIVFGAGEYKSGTLIGDAIIAHELAHVVQQSSANNSVAPIQQGATGYNTLEEEADRSAECAAVSLWSKTKGVLIEFSKNAIPQLRSGLRLQRCPSEAQMPTERAEAPAQPVQEEGGAEKERKDGDKKTGTESRFCATPSNHDGIVALLKKAKGNEPKGNLAYGYTFWEVKRVATIPELKIGWKKSGKEWIGTVQSTRAAMGAVEALYLKPGKYEVPGLKPKANFPQCKPPGKRVPFFSQVSKDMSFLSRRAEQEHCDDFKQAYELTYKKESDIINSFAGKPFGPGSKSQVDKDIRKALTVKGYKGSDALNNELNRLNKLSRERDKKRWHSLKADGTPVTADDTCSKLEGHTVKTANTNVPGPLSKDLIK